MTEEGPDFHWDELTQESLAEFTAADFSCGTDEGDDDWCDQLNRFLPENALHDQHEGYSKTYLFYDLDRNPIAYVTLSAQHIANYERERGKKNPETAKILDDPPFMDLPAVLIGRIATDQRYQGKGYGGKILRWISDLARELSIGCRFLALHVQHDNTEAIEFYERNGFTAPERHPRNDLLMLYDLAKSEEFPVDEETKNRRKALAAELIRRHGDANAAVE